jgi:PAS domain S-box-containing protein
MEDEDAAKGRGILDITRLHSHIDSLNRQIVILQQEKADLEIRLQATLERSDAKIQQLMREKADLEIILETMTEHSDTVEAELQDQAAEAIRQSEEQFRLIAEAAPVPVLISNITDGTILYANEIAGSTFSIPLSELIGRSTQDFYWNPGDRQTLLTVFAKHGFVQNHELQLRRADGSSLWAMLSLRPFMFNGELTFLSALCDISDRKQAEEALRIAEANYRSIFENAVEGIFQSTPEGRYINVNPSMARLFGYASPAEMMAQITTIDSQVYVEPRCRDEFRQRLEEHGEVVGFEYQAYRADGSIFWLAESARSVLAANGQLLYYEGTSVDITNRKREEEWLKQQLELLRFEIDQGKIEAQVAEITETDYFQQLKVELKGVRRSETSNESAS